MRCAFLLMPLAALLAVACGGNGSSPTPTPTPSPSPAVVLPSPTPEPTPTAEPAPATGSSFALVDLEATWEARGVTVTLRGPNDGFSGFSATAFDALLVRGDDSMELSILVYKDLEVIAEDWELTVGESPMLKEGRAVPDHISTWWNGNIIVLVRSSVGAISSDALDAFLALGEASVRQLPVGQNGDWITYRNDEYGFEFEHPKSCEVEVEATEAAGHFHVVGSRSNLEIRGSEGLSLAEFGNKFIDERFNEPYEIESTQSGSIDRKESITISYRFGGLNRYGAVTFVDRSGAIYIFSFEAGGFTCDFGLQVYGRMLSTFRFIE